MKEVKADAFTRPTTNRRIFMAEKRTDNVVLSVRVSRETKALIAKHAANTQSHGALVDRAIQAYVKNHK